MLHSQLVWGRTYAVGCGAYKCQEMEGADDYNDNALFLVCSYGPGYDHGYMTLYNNN